MPTVADYARKDLRARIVEKPPKSNRAPRIDAVLKKLGFGTGFAWCAAILSDWFRQCVPLGQKGDFPYSASSQAIMRHFRDKGLMSFCADCITKWGGVIGGWTNEGDSGHGHIFLVINRFTDNRGKVVAIGTIEGNTDLTGDRLGDGCYSLKRVLCPDGLWRVEDAHGKTVGQGKKLWFLNCTQYTGGKYLPEGKA